MSIKISPPAEQVDGYTTVIVIFAAMAASMAFPP
jgi:hypothetical protein